MDISADIVKKMMDMGVAAVNFGWLDEADAIFTGVEAARSEAPYGPIGKSLVLIAKGENEQAARVLREGALARDPDNLEAKKLLALALKLAGRGGELDKVWGDLSGTGDAKAKEFLEAIR